MTRKQAWFVHLSNVLVGGTGLVYGWMRYFAESDDPFSIANHPWQPDFQHAHIVLAPLSVFAVGWVWSHHVLLHWHAGTKRGRRTGIALALLFFPMVFSGYLLQTTVDDSWRNAWVWMHGITSGSWVALMLVHPFLKRPKGSVAPTSAP